MCIYIYQKGCFRKSNPSNRICCWYPSFKFQVCKSYSALLITLAHSSWIFKASLASDRAQPLSACDPLLHHFLLPVDMHPPENSCPLWRSHVSGKVVFQPLTIFQGTCLLGEVIHPTKYLQCFVHTRWLTRLINLITSQIRMKSHEC